MRLKENEIKEKNKIQQILKEATICRLALVDDSKAYIVPMNFGICENMIYLHSAPKGRKIDIIKKNNYVCFEVETDTKLVKGEKPCDFTMSYKSVIGYGKAYIVENKEDKIKGLDHIMRKYSEEKKFEYNAGVLDKMVIIRIEIESLTGKKSNEILT